MTLATIRAARMGLESEGVSVVGKRWVEGLFVDAGIRGSDANGDARGVASGVVDENASYAGLVPLPRSRPFGANELERGHGLVGPGEVMRTQTRVGRFAASCLVCVITCG